jgi:Holliday junction resolvase RusA-like endonuclease
VIITVYGVPRPHVGHAKSGWREAVKCAALEALERRTIYEAARRTLSVAPPGEPQPHCNGAIAGTVRVSMYFTLPKPKSAPKNRVTYPDRKPDLSKLVRATEEALTDADVWEDGARVIALVALKYYPGEGSHALDRPGAVIVIESV